MANTEAQLANQIQKYDLYIHPLYLPYLSDKKNTSTHNL
jgi:hypothetical protein